MRIGIDCWALRKNGGGARYVFESILEHFEKNQVRTILFLHPEAYECVHELQMRIGILRFSIKIKIDSPEEIDRYSRYVDIFYCPFNNISFRYYEKPVVSILHDVQERYFPQFFSSQDLQARLEDYDDILRSSQRVIAISEFCKQTFVETGVVSEKNIDVIYNAPQEALTLLAGKESSNDKLLVDINLVNSDYIIYPANFYKHKNHDVLFRAYRKGLDKGIELPKLVLVGVSWGGSDCPTVRINELGLSNHIDIVGGLSAEDLSTLYENCLFVIIPTQFEGFCMPAVEALLYGKPLLCSDLPILREVTGGHAVFFDQNSDEDVLLALKEASNESIDHTLTKQKIEHASSYTWGRAYNQTVEVLRAAYKDYYSEEIVSAVEQTKFSFLVLYRGEGEDQLRETIDSFLGVTFRPGRISIVVINYSHYSLTDINNYYNQTYDNRTVYFTEVKPEETLSGVMRHAELVGIVSAGNIILDTYYINVVKGYRSNPSVNLIVGEVRQIHEDQSQTFESHNYLRVVGDDVLLQGHVYPEMMVYINDRHKTRDWGQELNSIRCSFIKYMSNNDYVLVRSCFSKVKYRSVVMLDDAPDITPSIRYLPEINRIQTTIPDEVLHQQQEFLDHVESIIKQGIGANTTQKVFEVERVLEYKHGSRAL